MTNKPLKIALIYLALSIIIILFARYVHLIIVYIDLFYTWISLKLALYLPWMRPYPMTRQITALVIIPIVIVGIPALIYRLLYKKTIPYFYEAIWMVWLIIVLSNYLIH